MANNVSIAKAKKGDTVMLCMFTGCKTGPKEVVACDKSTVTVVTWHGEVTFDRKTGKQIEPMPKNERYASFITVDDGTFVHPSKKKDKKKTKATKKKVAKKQSKPEVDEEVDEEEETPKKTKKTSSKAKKQPDPEPMEEPDEDDDEEEEDDDFDDDDFEEVE